MQPNHRLDNPFAMMLDPQAVLARVAHSERLARLQRRICRPLDKPLLGRSPGGSAELAAYDSQIDDSLEADADDARSPGGDSA